MITKYTDIPGWFDFQQIYIDAVADAPNEGAIFVELGSFLGQSTAFMAQEIKRSGKSIRFYAVDLWVTDPRNDHNDWIRKHSDKADEKFGAGLFNLFKANMRALGVEDVVETLRMSTQEAAEVFSSMNQKFDLVFVDANHTYPFVSADIKTYLPMVKSGGVLAGHDIYFKDVKRAVAENLSGDRLSFTPSCWIYNKK